MTNTRKLVDDDTNRVYVTSTEYPAGELLTYKEVTDWHHQELQKAREEERSRIKALFPKLNPNSDSWGTTEMERILKQIDHSNLPPITNEESK